MIDTLLLISRFLLAALLLRAGIAKLLAREDFARAVANYRLLPGALVRPVATGLPWLESAAGLLLAAGAATGLAAAVVAALLLAFAAAVSVNLLRGRRIDCGCLGAAPARIGWGHTARNALLALLAAGVAARPPAVLSAGGGWGAAGRGLTTPDALAVLLAAGAAAATLALAREGLRAWRLPARSGRTR